MDTKLCLTFDDMKTAVMQHLKDKTWIRKLSDTNCDVTRVNFYSWFVTFRRESIITGQSYTECYTYPDLCRILILNKI